MSDDRQILLFAANQAGICQWNVAKIAPSRTLQLCETLSVKTLECFRLTSLELFVKSSRSNAIAQSAVEDQWYEDVDKSRGHVGVICQRDEVSVVFLQRKTARCIVERGCR